MKDMNCVGVSLFEMHRLKMIITIIFLFPFATACERADEEFSVTADAAATGNWVRSLFSVSETQLLLCGKSADSPMNSGNFMNARIPLFANSELQIKGRSVVVNQAGLYPLVIGPIDDGYQVIMYTPFYVFLDDIIAEDLLPARQPHPKADAITRKGFRIIGELLHSHFSEITGHLPEWYRIRDTIGFPSESYIWQIESEFVILKAYNGNDSDGISLVVTQDQRRIDQIRKAPTTDEPVFEDWGDPMPYTSEKAEAR